MEIEVSTAEFIGKELRRWVKRQPMKGFEFAKLIKFSQGSLSDIMNGKSYPSARTLAKICKYTDIDIEKLLTSQPQREAKAKVNIKIKNSYEFDAIANILERKFFIPRDELTSELQVLRGD